MSGRSLRDVLPDDLIFYILSFLSLKDLAATSQTNSVFYEIVDNCKSILRGEAEGDTWKDQYIGVVEKKKQREIASKEAMEMFNAGKFKPAVSYLMDKKIVENAFEMIQFIQTARNYKIVNKKSLGEFLCNPEHSEFADEFLHTFTFYKHHLVDSLRLLISQVDLPHTQQLGSFMEKFAKRYLTHNPGSEFTNAAAVCNMSFSIFLIMFNEFSVRRSAPVPMRKFTENTRGINAGRDLRHSTLEDTYDRVVYTSLQVTGVFQHIVRTGWLDKQNNDLLKMWQKRWFALSDGLLAYSRKPSEGFSAKKSFHLINVVINKTKNKRNLFYLTCTGDDKNAKKEHTYLYAESEQMCEAWIQSILECCTEGVVFQDGIQVVRKARRMTVRQQRATIKNKTKRKNTHEKNSENSEKNSGKSYSESPTNRREKSRSKTSSHGKTSSRPKLETAGHRSGMVSEPHITIGSKPKQDSKKSPETTSRISGENSHKSPEITPLPTSPTSPNGKCDPLPYFGVPLETILRREGGTIPVLIEKAMDYIMSTALDDEGILRISGSLAEMQRMREDIEQGKPIDFTRRDPNAVAGLLKSFFRELPEPMISKELNEGASAVLAFGEGQEVIDEVRNIVYTLPQHNFDLFRNLVYFLREVVAHSAKSKMNLNNVLRVMTPTVNCIPGIMSIAMENYSYFFEEAATEFAALIEADYPSEEVPDALVSPIEDLESSLSSISLQEITSPKEERKSLVEENSENGIELQRSTSTDYYSEENGEPEGEGSFIMYDAKA
eukprot:TRINITY_DN2174_c0_g1_i2.p1 TRINITY_DN2174_c0_g1~~TRINITY_DN2174_c0_g1_i2.p1  ORF type:complete len:776 (-),score=223.04 TRINITY_DN2174_c0_g1_i2:26-2353(-)